MAQAPHSRRHHTPLAKLNAPRLPAIVERRRLYKRLDAARKRPVVWISAPPGFGKTTLAASYLRARKVRTLWYQIDEGDGDLATLFHYLGLATKKAAPRHRTPLPHLTPEYLQGLPTFARRFFEELYKRLTPPALLVFDNYQEVPSDARFHEMVALGIEALPVGVGVIVMSRTSPPPTLARLQAAQQVSFLDEEVLKLTTQEARAIIRIHARSSKPINLVRQLENLGDRVQGWVAGLVLLLEQARTEPLSRLLTIRQTPQVVFEYLAREVMQRLSPEVQAFLLKTAFLPDMTASIAQRLTGVMSAADILANLYQSRYFTERRGAADYVYQYHPLFREFLLARATTSLSPDELRDVRQTAASLLEETGRIEEAVTLYREARQMSEIVRIILSRGPELLSQGRTGTLDLWLGYVPAELYEQEPWLDYWLGSCRLAIAPLESGDNFELAFVKFRAKDNKIGMLMAWAGIMSSIHFSWIDFHRMDPWIDVLLDLVPPDASFPSQEIEAQITFCILTALMWRRPKASLVRPWIERAKKLMEGASGLEKHTALSAATSNHFVWVGDLPSAEKYVNLLQSAAESESAPALTQAVFYTNKSVLSWHMGDAEAALQIAEHGLAISRKTGIHAFDTALLGSCVYGSLFLNDVVRAEKYLKDTAPLVAHPAHLMRGNYLLLQAWVARLKGNITGAWNLIQEAFELKGVKGTLFAEALFSYAAADVLHRLGDDRHASQYLNRFKQIEEEMGSVLLQFMRHLLECQIALDQGHEEMGLAALRRALAIGRDKRFSFFPWWLPKPMAWLCAKALEAKIEVDYVQELIRKTKLIPEGQAAIGEAWPWPVKIYTFGRFEIHLDGKLLPSRRKAPYRVLHLLKLIVALGGKGIPVSRLVDTLWPEADGDTAQETFHKTLQRLRSLLRYDQVIKVREGEVSLNSELCWVDALAFHALMNADDRVDRPHHDSQRQRYEQAVALYRGPFLDDDGIHEWTDRVRNRLRQQFVQAVENSNGRKKGDGQDEQAVVSLQNALRVDPLAEPLYPLLIKHFQALGRHNDAKSVWAQYRQNVVGVARAEPSLEMQQLLKTFSHL